MNNRKEQPAEDLLIWVDEQDREIGYGEKMDTHRREQLHRAFSLFLYNQKEHRMLLHRRAPGKYHSGGLWTNACCSHPRKVETLIRAVFRRAREELGLELAPDAPVTEVGKFQYYQKYETCAEHEIDHVFLLCAAEFPALQVDPRRDCRHKMGFAAGAERLDAGASGAVHSLVPPGAGAGAAAPPLSDRHKKSLLRQGGSFLLFFQKRGNGRLIGKQAPAKSHPDTGQAASHCQIRWCHKNFRQFRPLCSIPYPDRSSG